jgi:hypothetical protein
MNHTVLNKMRKLTRSLLSTILLLVVLDIGVVTEEAGSLVLPSQSVVTNHPRTLRNRLLVLERTCVGERTLEEEEEEYTYLIDRSVGDISIGGLMAVNKLGQLDQDDFIQWEFLVDDYSLIGFDVEVSSKTMVLAGQKNLTILVPGSLDQYGIFSMTDGDTVSWKLYGGNGSIPKEEIVRRKPFDQEALRNLADQGSTDPVVITLPMLQCDILMEPMHCHFDEGCDLVSSGSRNSNDYSWDDNVRVGAWHNESGGLQLWTCHNGEKTCFRFCKVAQDCLPCDAFCLSFDRKFLADGHWRCSQNMQEDGTYPDNTTCKPTEDCCPGCDGVDEAYIWGRKAYMEYTCKGGSWEPIGKTCADSQPVLVDSRQIAVAILVLSFLFCTMPWVLFRINRHNRWREMRHN